MPRYSSIYGVAEEEMPERRIAFEEIEAVCEEIDEYWCLEGEFLEKVFGSLADARRPYWKEWFEEHADDSEVDEEEDSDAGKMDFNGFWETLEKMAEEVEEELISAEHFEAGIQKRHILEARKVLEARWAEGAEKTDALLATAKDIADNFSTLMNNATNDPWLREALEQPDFSLLKLITQMKNPVALQKWRDILQLWYDSLDS